MTVGFQIKPFFVVKFRVNERRYEFGDSYGADDWVCAKIPHDGRIKKDCVPKVCHVSSLNQTLSQ